MRPNALPFDLSGGETPAPVARRQREAELIDKVCAWIDQHLHEDIGWERLIRISGMSAAQLQQAFRRYRKTTPMMYIRSRRAEIGQRSASAPTDPPPLPRIPVGVLNPPDEASADLPVSQRR